MKFYSATTKNEILLFAGKWMELENIILSEVSHVRRLVIAYLLPYVEYRQYECKQYYINIQVYIEHVSKSGTGRGD
jgi:hypothetical protein